MTQSSENLNCGLDLINAVSPTIISALLSNTLALLWVADSYGVTNALVPTLES